MKQKLPLLDLKQSYVVGTNITPDILNLTQNYVTGPNNTSEMLSLARDCSSLTSITPDILDLYKFPCRLKAAVFVLCLQGEIEASINLSEYRIRANDFITITPGSTIQFHNQSDDLRIYFAAFSSDIVSSVNMIKSTLDLFPVIIDNPVLHLRNEGAAILKDHFAFLSKHYPRKLQFVSPEIIKCILLAMLYGIGYLYQRHNTSNDRMLNRGEEISKQLLRLVMKYYTTERRVSFYAEQLKITPQHLSATIKQTTGETVTEVIAKVVIMDAKAQLKSTDQTIQEIAYSLHFPNVSFFGKYFKRYVGMSPNEYRNS